MTNTIVAESKQKSTTYTTYTGSINTVADGKIYFAIHDKTATASQLYFRNIVIGEGVITKAPAAVTFSVKPETDGTAKATITYTVPSTDIEGNPLDENSALTKVEIVRDGETIATLTDNIPTEADATFVDSEGLTLGKHSYNVVAYNAYGAGASEAVEVMVGPANPQPGKRQDDRRRQHRQSNHKLGRRNGRCRRQRHPPLRNNLQGCRPRL